MNSIKRGSRVKWQINEDGVDLAVFTVDILKAAATAATSIPALGVAAGIISCIFQQVSQAQQNTELALRIAARCARALATISKHLKTSVITPVVSDNIKSFEENLYEIQDFIEKETNRNIFYLTIFAKQRAGRLQELQLRVQETMTLFQITTLINLHDIIHRLSPGISSQGRFERALNEPDDRTTAPALVQAKALWTYNLDASEPDDLSFAAGDIITIVEETNADWWLGEHNGCRALFPANYVEKIATAPAPRNLPPAYVPPTGGRSVPSAPSEKKEYRPFMAAHSNANAPPPPGAGTNFVGLQQDPGQAEKKSKFGEYGNTMAHSAAGGVGFGAGAAIGHGLVRAIF